MHRYLYGFLLVGLLALPQTVAAQDGGAAVVRPAQPAAVMPADLGVPTLVEINQHSAHPPATGSGERDDMRTMTIAMGAMAGYMVIAMPVTVPALLAGVAGGYAARLWHDRRATTQ